MVSDDGKTLGNVFVYVKDGLGNYIFDTPTTPAKIDQQNCRYHPHVFGIRVNQPLEIVNSDPTLHNIHAMPKGNAEFNNGQPIQGMKMTHTFTAKEVMVPFKCDVHGWMNAYVGVLDHPYFATTEQGRQVRAEGSAAGHLHDRGVAREARHADRQRHAGPEGNQGRQLHVQSGRGGDEQLEPEGQDRRDGSGWGTAESPTCLPTCPT